MTLARLPLSVLLSGALLSAFPAVVHAADTEPAKLTPPSAVFVMPQVAVPVPAKSGKPRAGATSGVEEPMVSSRVPAKAAEGAARPVRANAAEPDGMAKGDEDLRRMLTERIAGSGEVLLRSSDVEPVKPRRAASPRPKALTKADMEAAKLQDHAAEGHGHWDYAGAGGPDRWGQMQPGFEVCAKGQRQSPIDIRQGISVKLDPIEFDYRAGPLRVMDNGHTLQVTPARGSAIQVMGKRYELVQFHFHRPAEERVDGRGFDMVMHLVHRDLDGRLAVVAVLLTEGVAHPEVQMVWNNWPLERNTEVVPSTSMDLNKLLPEDRRYVTYMGSLTTPPCTEGVMWMVLKTPVQVSAQQIAIFSHLYPMNARPIQPSHGRLIKDGQ